MDAIIPIAIATAILSFGVSEASGHTQILKPIESKDEKSKEIDFENYVKKNAEKPIFIENKEREPFLNTTIINNPGFKPVVDNLYFFKNYHQLNVKKYRMENNKVITDANINLLVDSPKIINYRDGYQFNYNNGDYFDGIIIRAQLLPVNDNEKQFRLIYEIEATDSEIKENKFAEKSAGNVLDQLVNKDVQEETEYKLIKNGRHVYTQRIYSLDEKIINIDKPVFVDVGPYRLEMKIQKGKKSELFYSAENIECKNKVCEVMKKNTINKK